MTYHVKITKSLGKPVVSVRNDKGRLRSFPLTKEGCLAAGEYLHRRGQNDWLCSSSLDFPRDVAPRFRYDPRTLIREGWDNKQKMKDKARHSLTAKMVEQYREAGLYDQLTKEERKLFQELEQWLDDNRDEFAG